MTEQQEVTATPGKRKRRWVQWTVGAVLALVCVGGCPLGLQLAFQEAYTGPVKKRARQLLSQTDHARLLAECRQLLTDKAVSKHSDAYLCISAGEPGFDALPPYLRSIMPTGVEVMPSDHTVLIHCGGGHHDYGFQAFADGHEKMLEGDEMENVKRVIPGLWFTEERDNSAVLR